MHIYIRHYMMSTFFKHVYLYHKTDYMLLYAAICCYWIKQKKPSSFWCKHLLSHFMCSQNSATLLLRHTIMKLPNYLWHINSSMKNAFDSSEPFCNFTNNWCNIRLIVLLTHTPPPTIQFDALCCMGKLPNFISFSSEYFILGIVAQSMHKYL